MSDCLNLDDIYTSNKFYPRVINLLIHLFKYDYRIHAFDSDSFRYQLDTMYPYNEEDNKYDVDDLWFELYGSSIYIVRNSNNHKVESVYITKDSIKEVYQVPPSYWSLFDSSKEIKFTVGETVGYQYKPCHKPDTIKSMDEASKVRFKLIELVYKELDPKFDTDLSWNVNLKDDVIEVIPVFNFTCGVIEDQHSDEVYRIESVNKFLDKFYEMEDILRTIRNLSLNKGVH